MFVRKRVVLGHAVSDLFFALETKSYIILTGPGPLVFEGTSSQDSQSVWAQLFWALFFRDQVYPGQVSLISVDEEEKTVTTYSDSGTKELFKYDDCFISCVSKVTFSDPDIVVMKPADNRVVDYYEVNSGSTHDLKIISTGDEFVNTINFYVTPRIDGNKNKKDLAVVSYITDSSLKEFEYSDTMVTFKTIQLLTDKLNPSKPIKIRHTHREVYPQIQFDFLERKELGCTRLNSAQTLEEFEYERCKSKYFR